MEKVQFIPEGEDRPVDFYVLEEARLGGKDYLLVTDSEDGDGDALILRMVKRGTDAAGPGAGQDPSRTNAGGTEGPEEDITYEIVEDEKELSAVLLLMLDTLDELGIEIEA